MKNKHYLLIVVLLLAVLSLGARFSTPTYEYKFEYGPSEKKCGELSTQGWELVAIGAAGGGGLGNVPQFVFRRAKN